jgi:hypothetical protein
MYNYFFYLYLLCHNWLLALNQLNEMRLEGRVKLSLYLTNQAYRGSGCVDLQN